MKKIAWILLLVGGVFIFSSSCKETDVVYYEGYVTIGNIGNLTMEAAVEGNWETIPAYSSVTWSVELNERNEVVVVLAEARPLGFNEYDSERIRIDGDRDVKTWLVGWDAAGASSHMVKKDTKVFSGKQNVSNLIAQYR